MGIGLQEYFEASGIGLLRGPRSRRFGRKCFFQECETSKTGLGVSFFFSIIRKQVCPKNLWKIVARKLDQLDSVSSMDELRVPPGNRLEALSGNRKDQFSIRINDQFRICFKWTETGSVDVEITDYH